MIWWRHRLIARSRDSSIRPPYPMNGNDAIDPGSSSCLDRFLQQETAPPDIPRWVSVHVQLDGIFRENSSRHACQESGTIGLVPRGLFTAQYRSLVLFRGARLARRGPWHGCVCDFDGLTYRRLSPPTSMPYAYSIPPQLCTSRTGHRSVTKLRLLPRMGRVRTAHRWQEGGLLTWNHRP